MRAKKKMRLSRKIFQAVTASLFTLLTLTLLLAFSLTYQNSLQSIKNGIDILLQQNNIILNNLIEKVEEATQAPSNDRQLYNLLNFEEEESYVASSMVRRDLSAYFINTFILPVQKYLPSVEYHFYIPEGYPAELLYQNTSAEGRIHSERSVAGEEWFRNAQELEGEYFWFVRQDNPGSIYMAKSVWGFFETYSKQRIGVALLQFDIADLMTQVRNSTFTANSDYYLVDPVKNWYSIDGAPLLNGTEPDGLNYETGLQTITVEQGRYLCGITRLSNQWFFISLTPYGDIVAGTYYLIELFAVAMAVGVALCLLISLYASRRIARPISGFSQAMLAVRKESELAQQFSDTSDIIEISQLYESYCTLLKRIQALLLDIHQKGINEKNAEIKALQAQISPHFLFNSLDSLCWAVRDTGNAELPAFITSLSDILRYSLRDFDKRVPIQEELQIVKRYIRIQQFCYSVNIVLVENIDASVLQYTLPKLTLQPLVENAILHGMLEHGEKSDTIVIRAFHRDGDTILQITDTFPADINRMYQIIRDTAQVEKHGIKNVNSRLKMLFGEPYGLDFKMSEDGGLIVEIRLPE